MGKLSAFEFISLNGFFEGAKGDISWHMHGSEENQFSAESLKSGSTLLFGRITYQMMASYWPTPAAMKNDPTVARGMNNAEKIVFSRTLKIVDWKNTHLITKNITEEIRRMKNTAGKNMTILGSGSIIKHFAEAKLIDEFQIMIDPVILASGRPLFDGLKHTVNLKLMNTKVLKSGVVLLSYRPV